MKPLNFKNQSKKFFGNYLGIVVQNNDPDRAGKIKVWVPHVSPSVYAGWADSNTDKKFKSIGRNVDSDLSVIIEDLKAILPWAQCAAPIVGSTGVEKYNASEQTSTASDSNTEATRPSIPDFIRTKYSLNKDGVGEKPAQKYEQKELRVSDAFTDSADVDFEHANKYGYSYVPRGYSNAAKGTFSIPSVGSHVWIFFEGGDPTTPVYFAASYSAQEWSSIYDDQDYPASYENQRAGGDHNTNTYRSKYVVNQKGGSFEIVSTDNQELLKMTHFSGSFKEFNNQVSTEFAVNNHQLLVQNDRFETTRGVSSSFTGGDNDLIIVGDQYQKIGDVDYDLYQQYKQLLEGVADAKQLFDIQRAQAIPTQTGFFKKTSIAQTKNGVPGPCPLCSDPNRPQIWSNSYSFTGVTVPAVSSETTGFDFSNVSSVNDSLSSTLIQSSTPGDLLGTGPCPVCGGSGLNPSSQNGVWTPEDKDTLVVQRLNLIKEDMVLLEKRMGEGGNSIINVVKNKIENIGLVLNDFPAIRIDEHGKTTLTKIQVFKQGVAAKHATAPIFEYVHVDDLPGGTKVDNINNKWNVNVGSGGVSIKTLGGLDVSGAITNIAGQQTNITAEHEVNINSDSVNITGNNIVVRDKNGEQVVVDGSIGVSNNAVIGGSTHIEGELSVHHITAPVEIQETEPVILYGELVAGKTVTDGNGKAVATPNSVKIYAHTHPFKNVPLKLMQSKDDVRAVGSIANGATRGSAIPVEHERKSPQSI